MSTLPLGNYTNSKETKNSLKDKSQELIKAAEDFTKKRKEEIKTDIKHYSKENDKESNPAKTSIRGFTSGIGSMVSSFLAYKAQEYLDKILNGKFGAGNSSNMFGNLKSRFSTSQNQLGAMFLDNNTILYDFIDYSKAHLKKRTRKTVEYAERIEFAITEYFNTYASLSAEELENWINNFRELVGTAEDHLKDAKVSLSLYEDVLVNHGIGNEVNKNKAYASIDTAVTNLKGFRSDTAISSLPIILEDIIELFREFSFEVTEIETARSNHAKMPELLDEVSIASSYGSDVLRRGIELLDDLIADIGTVYDHTTNAENVASSSVFPWILTAESIKAIVETVEGDIEPPVDGPEYDRVTVVSDALEVIDILGPLDTLKKDIESLTSFTNDAYRVNKITDLTALRTRITTNLSDLKTKIQTIEDSLNIPDELNPDVSYVIQDMNSSGFDQWVAALLSGDILGFLMMKFGNSTSAGKIITSLQQIISLGGNANSMPEAVFFYQSSRADLLKKEQAARAKINVIEDILPDNLKQSLERYDKKMEKLRRSVSGGIDSAYGF